MASLQKLKNPHFLKCGSLLCSGSKVRSSSKLHIHVNRSQIIRFCCTETALNSRNYVKHCEKQSRELRYEAQAALLEYLHHTRSIQFMDAENMSKNSPQFLDRLLQRLDIDDGDVAHSLARFLRYHPINEFEPFFESIGLKPSEYASFLPRNLIFLNDDQLFLHNYYVLCNYGVPRNRIGKIYKEVAEVFRYDYGILQSKLEFFQKLELKQSFVVKVIASSPDLLRGDVSCELLEFLDKLKSLGIEYDWLEERMLEDDSYNWKCMLEVVCLLSELGLSAEKLGQVIRNHPDILLDCSGRFTFCIFGFLLKFGSKPNDIVTVFLEFPHVSVVNFTYNLHQCYRFLVEIKMPVQDIGRLFRMYPLLLGSCKLKRVKSLLCTLNCGVSRLCQMVQDDPYVLKKWVLRVRVDRLQEPSRVSKVRIMKTKFLLTLGFVEKSKEMEVALKLFRGKGVELQERFDCLVNNGLNREDVIGMVKVAPQILNQPKDVIERKIGFFVKDLGYPVSDLVSHPALISYTTERVKLRLLMYKWLKNEEAVNPKLALSTLFACSEETFVRKYVNSHPGGTEFWERLKKKIYSV